MPNAIFRIHIMSSPFLHFIGNIFVEKLSLGDGVYAKKGGKIKLELQ